jgi:alpha-glucosidase
MLGPSLLIAPVYQGKSTTRKVYLPANTAWYHYQTGKYYATDADQGKWVEVLAALNDEAAPFFVKAGSMMCFGKVMDNMHASPDNERRVQIFPEIFADTVSVNGKSERKTFILYEDDGDTLYHETGQAYAEIHVWMETTETEIHVGLDIINDGFFPYYDTVWVTCPIASETRKLVFEGQDDTENDLKTARNLPRMVDDDTMHVYTGLKLRMKTN